MHRYGLIGKDISYSFSRNYFKNKFKTENIKNTSYENFDINNIIAFENELKHLSNVKGFNVTIPYKESIIPSFALKALDIDYCFVSRQASKAVSYTYKSLTEKDIKTHQIIINCTPLGTFPNVEACPDIPYQSLTQQHILFDLIYNPEVSKFLNYGNEKGATTINGYKMLELQAEKSWRIWNK